jgi:hypothetical protein
VPVCGKEVSVGTTSGHLREECHLSVTDSLFTFAHAQTFQGHCAAVTSKAQVRRRPASARRAGLYLEIVPLVLASRLCSSFDCVTSFWDLQQGASYYRVVLQTARPAALPEAMKGSWPCSHALDTANAWRRCRFTSNSSHAQLCPQVDWALRALLQEKKIARASHNMFAYRLMDAGKGVQVCSKAVISPRMSLLGAGGRGCEGAPGPLTPLFTLRCRRKAVQVCYAQSPPPPGLFEERTEARLIARRSAGGLRLRQGGPVR